MTKCGYIDCSDPPTEELIVSLKFGTRDARIFKSCICEFHWYHLLKLSEFTVFQLIKNGGIEGEWKVV